VGGVDGAPTVRFGSLHVMEPTVHGRVTPITFGGVHGGIPICRKVMLRVGKTADKREAR